MILPPFAAKSRIEEVIFFCFRVLYVRVGTGFKIARGRRDFRNRPELDSQTRWKRAYTRNTCNTLFRHFYSRNLEHRKHCPRVTQRNVDRNDTTCSMLINSSSKTALFEVKSEVLAIPADLHRGGIMSAIARGFDIIAHHISMKSIRLILR